MDSLELSEWLALFQVEFAEDEARRKGTDLDKLQRGL